MDVPKPPFYSATDELLYSIYLKLLSPINALTASDINTLEKLNAVLIDADLVSAESFVNTISSLKGNVPSSGNTLEKLYNVIQGLNYLSREDIDTLAEINSLLVDADLIKTEDLTTAINLAGSKKEFQFYFHGQGGDDDDECQDRDRLVIKGKINSLIEDFTNELSGVTYKSRIDTSSTWITHANLAALQTWINTSITGDHLTGVRFWLKCIPTYKPGKCGDAANLFAYRVV
jgi:hypothetical protein